MVLGRVYGTDIGNANRWRGERKMQKHLEVMGYRVTESEARQYIANQASGRLMAMQRGKDWGVWDLDHDHWVFVSFPENNGL
jgi:hypothetical protein